MLLWKMQEALGEASAGDKPLGVYVGEADDISETGPSRKVRSGPKSHSIWPARRFGRRKWGLGARLRGFSTPLRKDGNRKKTSRSLGACSRPDSINYSSHAGRIPQAARI